MVKFTVFPGQIGRTSTRTESLLWALTRPIKHQQIFINQWKNKPERQAFRLDNKSALSDGQKRLCYVTIYNAVFPILIARNTELEAG